MSNIVGPRHYGAPQRISGVNSRLFPRRTSKMDISGFKSHPNIGYNQMKNLDRLMYFHTGMPEFNITKDEWKTDPDQNIYNHNPNSNEFFELMREKSKDYTERNLSRDKSKTLDSSYDPMRVRQGSNFVNKKDRCVHGGTEGGTTRFMPQTYKQRTGIVMYDEDLDHVSKNRFDSTCELPVSRKINYVVNLPKKTIYNPNDAFYGDTDSFEIQGERSTIVIPKTRKESKKVYSTCLTMKPDGNYICDPSQKVFKKFKRGTKTHVHTNQLSLSTAGDYAIVKTSRRTRKDSKKDGIVIQDMNLSGRVPTYCPRIYYNELLMKDPKKLTYVNNLASRTYFDGVSPVIANALPYKAQSVAHKSKKISTDKFMTDRAKISIVDNTEFSTPGYLSTPVHKNQRKTESVIDPVARGLLTTRPDINIGHNAKKRDLPYMRETKKYNTIDHSANMTLNRPRTQTLPIGRVAKRKQIAVNY